MCELVLEGRFVMGVACYGSQDLFLEVLSQHCPKYIQQIVSECFGGKLEGVGWVVCVRTLLLMDLVSCFSACYA